MGPMNNKDEMILTIGSTYLIRSINSRDNPLETNGKFIAYTMIGQDLAFVMELEDGSKRAIPSHMILAIDIIETAEEEEKEEEVKAGYYG